MTPPFHADTRLLTTAAKADLHILMRFPEEDSLQLHPLVVLNVLECVGKCEMVQWGKFKCLWHQGYLIQFLTEKSIIRYC